MRLELRSLTKIYRTKGESVVAVNNVSLSLPEHGFVIIVGRSGCGKTTLLNLLGKMDMPTGGMALLDGKSIYSMPDYRDKIGFVFQEIHLFPFMTAKRNIELAQDYAGVHKRPATEYLRLVGMEEFAEQKVRLLSGGEQQRVAVARMLAKEPDIVLADEPTGALDEDNAETVFRILQEIAKTRLVIAVTHDEESAERFADLLLHMTDGKLTVVRDTLASEQEIAASATNDTPIHAERHKNKLIHFGYDMRLALSIMSLAKLKSTLYVLALSLLMAALLLSATVLYTTTANVTWHRIQDCGLQWIQISNTEPIQSSTGKQLTEETVNYLNKHTNCLFYGYNMPGNLANTEYGLTYAMNEKDFRYTEGGPGEAVITDTYAQTSGYAVGDKVLVAHGEGMYGNTIEIYATVSGIIDTSAMTYAELNMIPKVLSSLEYMNAQGWELMMNLFPQQATISTNGLSHGKLNHLLNRLHANVTQMELTDFGESATAIASTCENQAFEQSKQLLLAVTAILAVTIFAFTIYFIRGHIETNRRMLAILQVLGAKQKDFVIMFLLQFAILFTTALLLAACCIAPIFPHLPQIFFSDYIDHGIQFFFVNIYYLPALLLCPLVTIPATFLPLKDIHRKAPVELLRR